MLREAFENARALPDNHTPARKFALNEAWQILMDAGVIDPSLEVQKSTTLDNSARRRSYPVGVPFQGLVPIDGAALRKARTGKGLSLKAAGKLVKLNKSTLSRLENNKYRFGIDPKTVAGLKALFGENITQAPEETKKPVL